MPPMDVPWPPMYFVAECTETSAPWSNTRQWIGVGRRVVDDQRQALGMRRVGPGADVDDVELRVADRLGEHETRLVVGEPGDGVGVVGIGPAHLDAVLRQRVREQVVRAAVQRRDRDDVVAGSRDVEHGVGHGGLARGRRAGGEPALERRDALLEDVPGRVHDARVDVARHLEREQVGGVLGVVELVRRRLVDRHCPRLRGRVRGLTAVQGDRLGALSTHVRSSRFASRERKRPPVSRRAFGVAERSTNRLSSSALRTRDGNARRWMEHLPGRSPGCCGVVGPVPSTARDDVASGSLAHATRCAANQVRDSSSFRSFSGQS